MVYKGKVSWAQAFIAFFVYGHWVSVVSYLPLLPVFFFFSDGKTKWIYPPRNSFHGVFIAVTGGVSKTKAGHQVHESSDQKPTASRQQDPVETYQGRRGFCRRTYGFDIKPNDADLFSNGVTLSNGSDVWTLISLPGKENAQWSIGFQVLWLLNLFIGSKGRHMWTSKDTSFHHVGPRDWT